MTRACKSGNHTYCMRSPERGCFYGCGCLCHPSYLRPEELIRLRKLIAKDKDKKTSKRK